MLLTMLSEGRLHLTAINLLAPHLTRENRNCLLERATHGSKRQIQELIAEIAPRPDVPGVLRKLPEKRSLPGARHPVVSNNGEDLTLALGPAPIPERRPGPSPELGLDGVAGRDHAFDTGAPEVATNTTTGFAPARPASPSVVQPLTPRRYKVQFTASAEFREKLE